MAKLYFRYGAMGSSKTANALMVKFNYEEKGHNVLLVKPDVDVRDGYRYIKSRIGLSSKCILISDLINIMGDIKTGKYQCIIVDEAQFLCFRDVDFLAKIVDDYSLPVICYGLRTDFQGNFFPGSLRLMEIADEIEEIKTICWCGHKAIFNVRFDKNGIVRDGDQVALGANEQYTSVCRKHFMSGEIHGPNK